MSERDGIAPSVAEAVDRRLKQAFAFMRDVVANPLLLDEIPSGSTLVNRDVMFQGTQLRLTAHQSPNQSGEWTARVSGPPEIAEASRQWAPPSETRGMAGKWGSPPTYPERGPTAAAALDALEEKLREADRVSTTPQRVSGN